MIRFQKLDLQCELIRKMLCTNPKIYQDQSVKVRTLDSQLNRNLTLVNSIAITALYKFIGHLHSYFYHISIKNLFYMLGYFRVDNRHFHTLDYNNIY